jgi:hypothetical protein
MGTDKLLTPAHLAETMTMTASLNPPALSSTRTPPGSSSNHNAKAEGSTLGKSSGIYTIAFIFPPLFDLQRLLNLPAHPGGVDGVGAEHDDGLPRLLD